MIRRFYSIRRDEKGAATIEMALALPVLVSMIYGIFTLGQLLEANAGIQHALGEGARYGNLCLSSDGQGNCTLPTSTAIGALVNQKLFGTGNGTFDTPTVNTSSASSGYVTVTVVYHQTLNFAFYIGSTVTLTRSKKVYLATTPWTQADCNNPPTGLTAPVSCSIYS